MFKRIVFGAIAIYFFVVASLFGESIKDKAFQAKEIAGYSSIDGWKTWTGSGISFKEDKFSFGLVVENESPVSEAGIFATVNIEKVEGLNDLKDNIFKNVFFFLPEDIVEKIGSSIGVMGLCNWKEDTRGGIAVVVDVLRLEF